MKQVVVQFWLIGATRETEPKAEMHQADLVNEVRVLLVFLIIKGCRLSRSDSRLDSMQRQHPWVHLEQAGLRTCEDGLHVHVLLVR